MELEMNESFFKELWPFICDENITDIKWNGRNLWIEDLKKGRYKSDVILSYDFLKVFTTRIAALSNTNFNASTSSLQASTDNLRIHAIHPFRTGDKTFILAIRKTPAIARLTYRNIVTSNYTDQFTRDLLGALIRSHCSGIIIGETGAGKTELQKYLASCIPDNESCQTVEDTLEMRLPELYPYKDISAVKIDHDYTAEQAISDALRLFVKHLWIAEARGREITRILEGASTGCCAWTTLHAENVWEIPDRIVQMAGKGGSDDRTSFENDVYTFFNVGIKVRKITTSMGVTRSIDQICFFERNDKHNNTVLFMDKGRYTGKKLPQSIIRKLNENYEIQILNVLKKGGHC